MEVKSDAVGTWNVHESRQIGSGQRGDGKSNVDILGISKLERTGMGEFNSDDHYLYYSGQESLRRKGVAIIVNKKVENTVLGCNLKNNRMISVHFQGKPFSNCGQRFMTLYRRRESRPSPRKRNAKSQSVCPRRPYK